mgnify:CR=1 FL=1
METPEILARLLTIGLTGGALIALNAIAISVIYSTVRTLNLAHGDLFALATVVTTSLIKVLALGPESGPLELAGGLALTLVVSVALAAGASGLIERAAFRPFRGRSRLAPLVATLGISFMLYQGGIVWRYLLPNWIPGEHRSVPGIPEFPRDSIPEVYSTAPLLTLFGAPILVKDALVLIAAVGVAAGVTWLLGRTRLGRAIRACAENAEAALILGIDPTRQINRAFVLGGALAGLAAFLHATYYTAPYSAYGAASGLIAFSAALLGGIGNPLGALAAGLIIGVARAFSDYYLSTAVTSVLVQALLIGLIVLRAANVPADGSDRDALTASVSTQLSPRVRRGLWLALGLALVAPWGLGYAGTVGLTSILIFMLMALGLNVLLGMAGLLDLGYAVCFGLGGYIAATLSDVSGGRMEFAVVALAAAFGAGLFGALNGWLTLRLRGDYLAIVTLALGQIARGLIVLLAGPDGLAAVAAPRLATLSLSTPTARYWLALALVAALVIASLRLLRSRVGRAWLALAEDPLAAEASGIDLTRSKTLAFVLSTAIAGLAGALYASTFTTIDPESLDFRVSTMVLAMVVLGGAGSVPGALVGAGLIALYDRAVIPWLGETLSRFQPGGGAFGSAFDVRGMSYLMFGLLLYVTVWIRARRPPGPNPP